LKGLPKKEALCNRSENNDNTIITGITLGIVNAILVGYGAFITILYKRRSRNKGKITWRFQKKRF
jgi:formylmethanofuran dehydrogenase subunit E